ncbi:MAG: hypothetical protein ACOYMO_06855 [Phycisphaerales bacterium]
MHRFTSIASASATVAIAAAASATTVLTTGPSSSSSPYVVGVTNSPVREVVSIITVGDTIGGYQMLGIPDGMGAFMSGDDMKLFVNHEFTVAAASGKHAHQTGSATGGGFIAAWTINPATFQVINGYDAMTSTATVTAGTGSLQTFARLCSGDVAATLAYYNPATGRGSNDRFYLTGEESGAGGRMLATDLDTGVVHQMTAFDPSSGSWENGVARPMESDTTVVIGTSDGGANRVFVYIGTKQSTGNAAERAGLMNGTSYGIQVQVGGSNVSTESRDFCFSSSAPAVFSGRFTLAAGGTAAGTGFLRPEDGAWDPMNPRDFYFVNTDRMSTTSAGAAQSHASRLFRLRFDNVNDPAAGGTIEAVLDGTDVMEMGDNLCVYNTIQGGTRVLLQEDPGNHPHSAKTLVYDADTDSLQVILASDSARFGDTGVGATSPFTIDEENSGVVDARDTLGLGWFMGNMQAHYALPAPMIEGGQLYAFFSPQLVGSCDQDLSPTLDAAINGEDLAMLCLGWGSSGRTDLNGDNTTDAGDLSELLLSWGDCAQ